MFFKDADGLAPGQLNYVSWANFLTAVFSGIDLTDFVRMNEDAAYNIFTTDSMLGAADATDSISPNLRRLYDSAETAVLDYAAAGIVEILGPAKLLVSNGTPWNGSTQTGALQCQGGIYFRGRSGGEDPGGYKVDLFNQWGVAGIKGNFYGRLGLVDCAGHFNQVGGSDVKLASENGAVVATGRIKTDADSGYWIGENGPFVSKRVADLQPDDLVLCKTT